MTARRFHRLRALATVMLREQGRDRNLGNRWFKDLKGHLELLKSYVGLVEWPQGESLVAMLKKEEALTARWPECAHKKKVVKFEREFKGAVGAIVLNVRKIDELIERWESQKRLEPHDVGLLNGRLAFLVKLFRRMDRKANAVREEVRAILAENRAATAGTTVMRVNKRARL